MNKFTVQEFGPKWIVTYFDMIIRRFPKDDGGLANANHLCELLNQRLAASDAGKVAR
jgi:hypothetical protein